MSSFAIGIVGVGTSLPSGDPDPKWLEYAFYTLQPLFMLHFKLSLGALLILMVLTSLLYGYLIAYWLRPRPPDREDHDA